MRRRDSIRARVKAEDELLQGGMRSATCNPELTISTWAILPAGNTIQYPFHENGSVRKIKRM